jgi:hypothetical protein
MSAHNQWLAKTRSIPYWTASVYSSTVTNDEGRFTVHSHSRGLNWSQGEPNISHHVFQFLCYPVFLRYLLRREHASRTVAWQWLISCVFVAAGTWLASRWLAMDFRYRSAIPAFKHHFTMCTIVSVACILQQREMGEVFWPNSSIISPCLSLYTHEHISFNREQPLLCYKLLNYLTKSCPTRNPRPRARIPLSEVSIYTEPSNWSVLNLSGPIRLGPM